MEPATLIPGIVGAVIGLLISWLIHTLTIRKDVARTRAAVDELRLAQTQLDELPQLRRELQEAQSRIESSSDSGRVQHLEAEIASLRAQAQMSAEGATKPFEARVAELERQLSDKTQEASEALTLQRDAEGEIQRLRAVVANAGPAEALKEALDSSIAERQQLAEEIRVLRTQAQDPADWTAIVSERDHARAQVTALEAALREAEVARTSMADEIAALSQYSAGGEELEAFRSENHRLRDEIAVLSGAAGQLAALQEELSAARAQASRVDELQASLAAAKAETEAMRAEPSRTTREAIATEVAELKQQLEEAKLEATALREQQPDLAELQHALESAHAELSQRADITPEALAELRASLEEARRTDPAERETLLAQIASLSQAIPEPELLPGLQGELTAAAARIESLEILVERTRASEAKLRQRLADASVGADDLALARRQVEVAESAAQNLRHENDLLKEFVERYDAAKREVAVLREAVEDALKDQEELRALREQVVEIDELRREQETLQLRLADSEELRGRSNLLEQENRSLTNRLMETDAKLAEEAESAILATELQRSLAETNERQLSEIAEKTEEIAQLTKRLDRVEATLADRMKEAEREQVAARDQREASEAAVKEREAQIAELRARLDQESVQQAALTTRLTELSAVSEENANLRAIVDRGVATQEEMEPVLRDVANLSGALAEIQQEQVGTRKTVQALLEELRRLRGEAAELGKLRAAQRQLLESRSSSSEVDGLRSRIGEVSAQLSRTQTDAAEAREALALAEQEIGRLRSELTRSGDLGELG